MADIVAKHPGRAATRLMIVSSLYESPCGQLTLGEIDGRLCLCDWNIGSRRQTVDERLCKHFSTTIQAGDSVLLREAKRQLEEYFFKGRHEFDVPLVYCDSQFREKVWSALQGIAYGTTMSYKDFAAKIGQPTAVRAIASAIGANPLSIFLPCHRVMGTGGSLTGYAGGLPAKRHLLDLESHYLNNSE